MHVPLMPRHPVAIETSELRKRLRLAIDQSRKNAAARRAKLDEAASAYAELLKYTATPLVQMLANALRAEGYNFAVFTPHDGLRMSLERSGDDFIEFALDTSQDEPHVILRVSRSRGRRVVQHERPLKGRTPIDQLSDDDVLEPLLQEIAPFVER